MKCHCQGQQDYAIIRAASNDASSVVGGLLPSGPHYHLVALRVTDYKETVRCIRHVQAAAGKQCRHQQTA